MRVFDMLKGKVIEMEELRDIDGLILSLKDEDEHIRIESARALGRIRPPEAVEALSQTLNDPNFEVKKEAMEALGRIGTPEAVEALIPLTNDPQPEIREAVITIFGQIGSSKTVPLLLDHLQDEENSIRWRSIEALGRIGSPEAVEALIPLINDPQPEIREESIVALGRIAINPYIEDLNSEDTDLKHEAVENILNIPKLKYKEKELDTKSKKTVIEKEVEEDSSKIDAENLKNKLMAKGYYGYIKNFVNRVEYDYWDDFVKCAGYDYQPGDVQKLKELLEQEEIQLDNQELNWLIQNEIKEQEYQKFKQKITQNQPQKLEDYLQNYLKHYPQNTPQQQKNLQRTLQENQLHTPNLPQKIKETQKQKQIQQLKPLFIDHPISKHREGSAILIEFKKKELWKKQELLNSKGKYGLLKDFVKYAGYDYQPGDVQKLKELLEQEEIQLDNQELNWLIQNEIKEQEYQKFKQKITQNQPQKLEDYLQNYLKHYPQNTPQQQKNLQRTLQENQLHTPNLPQKIKETQKQKQIQQLKERIKPNQNNKKPVYRIETPSKNRNIQEENEPKGKGEDSFHEKAVYYYNLGNLFYDLGQSQEAIKYYESAILNDPEYIMALKNRGLVLYLQGKYQKALASFNQILNNNTDYGPVWVDISFILYALGKYSLAQQCYHQAISLEKDENILTENTRKFFSSYPDCLEKFEEYLDKVSLIKMDEDYSAQTSPLAKILSRLTKLE